MIYRIMVLSLPRQPPLHPHPLLLRIQLPISMNIEVYQIVVIGLIFLHHRIIYRFFPNFMKILYNNLENDVFQFPCEFVCM